MATRVLFQILMNKMRIHQELIIGDVWRKTEGIRGQASKTNWCNTIVCIGKIKPMRSRSLLWRKYPKKRSSWGMAECRVVMTRGTYSKGGFPSRDYRARPLLHEHLRRGGGAVFHGGNGLLHFFCSEDSEIERNGGKTGVSRGGIGEKGCPCLILPSGSRRNKEGWWVYDRSKKD